MSNGTMKPTLLKNVFCTVVLSSLVGRYAAAIDSLGRLWTWGYGGHGNLGHGDRASRAVPTLVKAIDYSRLKVQAVGCTRGQSGPKGGFFYPKDRNGDKARMRRNPGAAAATVAVAAATVHSKIVGSEGPHTLASAVARQTPTNSLLQSRDDDLAVDTTEQADKVPAATAAAAADDAMQRGSTETESNAREACASSRSAVDEGQNHLDICGRAGVYAWGTGHKGQLANVNRKPKLGDRFDELSPYLIGGLSRNSSEGALTGCVLSFVFCLLCCVVLFFVALCCLVLFLVALCCLLLLQ